MLMRYLVAFALFASLAAAAPKKKNWEAGGYVGTEACLACHEDMGKAFLKTRHGGIEKDTGRGWKDYSCESCHGPGLKHGEAAEAKFILNHAKAPAKEVDASCLTCHKNQATHAGRIHGSHSAGQVSCVNCHSVHHEKPKPASTCSSCHTDVVAQFLRPHAHRMTQGTVGCVDCHNPHGTLQAAGLRGTARTRNNEPGCLNCHADKRGPFAFEHAPMRLEGCGSCHEPHGSANPRMLNRAEVLNLCLECHSNLPAPSNRTGTLGSVATGAHDLRLPIYRNCTSCHTKIHGSHVNRDFLR
jgi:DmsE family decaheme c-type cytochrome